MQPSDFEREQEYTQSQILGAFEPDCWEFHGEFLIGELLLVCKQDVRCASFIMTGIMGRESVYRCVYSDF